MGWSSALISELFERLSELLGKDRFCQFSIMLSNLCLANLWLALAIVGSSAAKTGYIVTVWLSHWSSSYFFWFRFTTNITRIPVRKPLCRSHPRPERFIDLQRLDLQSILRHRADPRPSSYHRPAVSFTASGGRNQPVESKQPVGSEPTKRCGHTWYGSECYRCIRVQKCETSQFLVWLQSRNAEWICKFGWFLQAILKP